MRMPPRRSARRCPVSRVGEPAEAVGKRLPCAPRRVMFLSQALDDAKVGAELLRHVARPVRGVYEKVEDGASPTPDRLFQRTVVSGAVVVTAITGIEGIGDYLANQ